MIILLLLICSGPMLAEASLSTVPSNTVAVVGSTVELHCTSVNAPPTDRVLWAEFASHPYGQVLSDGKNVLSTHPNSDRYSIVGDELDYNLQIRDVRLSDAGKYLCQDINSVPPAVFKGYAELTVQEYTGGPVNLKANPDKPSYVAGDKITCTADADPPATFRWLNMRTNEYTEGDTVTVEKSWEGFSQTLKCEASNDNDGISYTGSLYVVAWVPIPGAPANLRVSPIFPTYVVGTVLSCAADAKPYPYFEWYNTITQKVKQSSAIRIDEDWTWDNVTLICLAQNVVNGITYTERVSINIFISRGPSNLQIYPNKTSYEIGDVLTCTADADPPAQFEWLNTKTLEVTRSSEITIDETWKLDDVSMMCQATNVINGKIYSQKKYINVTLFGEPKNVQIYPIKETYYIGDILTCIAEANPNATFRWINVRTNEYIYGDTMAVEDTLAGYEQTIRCEARNAYNGKENYNSAYTVVTVPPVESPTNMQVHPSKSQYDIGDVLKCTADAHPFAAYVWTNMRTLVDYPGDTIRLNESLIGHTTQFRCQAKNHFYGKDHEDVIFINTDFVGGPVNLQIHPTKTTYFSGDKLTCTADSNPPATFRWLNMRTNETIDGDTITVEESWIRKNTTLKCEASNVHNGIYYTNHLYMTLYVPDTGAPTYLEVHPNKTTYDIGDILTCSSDADPPAYFSWTNMNNYEYYRGDTIRINESWSKWNNVTLLCQASSTLNGYVYVLNKYINIIISPSATTTTSTTTTTITTTTQATTTSTTTTQAPSRARCRNSTGYWKGSDPDAALCLEVDSEGRVFALWRNDSSPYFVYGYGSADTLLRDYKHVAFSVVWPFDQGWVTGYIGECQVCNGQEVILLSGVSRSRAWAPGCGQTGGTVNTKLYTLTRRLPSCRGLELDVSSPQPWMKEKMGVEATAYKN